MKISNNESYRATQTGGVTPANSVAPSPTVSETRSDNTASPAAHVELSSQAQLIASAKAAVDAVPDTRDDLVTKLKAQVDAGTYQVSGADIAEQMLRRSQADRIR